MVNVLPPTYTTPWKNRWVYSLIPCKNSRVWGRVDFEFLYVSIEAGMVSS